jgi:hypothetical protein
MAPRSAQEPIQVRLDYPEIPATIRPGLAGTGVVEGQPIHLLLVDQTEQRWWANFEQLPSSPWSFDTACAGSTLIGKPLLIR